MGGLQKKQAQSDGALKAGRYRMLEDSGELEWRRAARSVGLSILRRLVNFLDIHLNTPLPKYLLYFTADPYCIIMAITLKHLIVFFKKKLIQKKSLERYWKRNCHLGKAAYLGRAITG